MKFPLSCIFNSSVSTSSIPAIWKTAIITPIFKNGSPNEANNYRPISLTCIASKMMETIIKDTMLDHLNKSRLISRQQHGFWLVTRLIHNYLNRVMIGLCTYLIENKLTLPIWILLKHSTLLCTTSYCLNWTLMASMVCYIHGFASFYLADISVLK